MQLIGMLDSPYVRRVAISMKRMGIPFDHNPLSVFRNYDQFRQISPTVKVPTLVCDDGVILLDSTLIIDYLESLVPVEKRLMPSDLAARRIALRNVGLALVACEKSVQRFYELRLRPPEKQHAPWLDRVNQQMTSAFEALEAITSHAKPWIHGDVLMQDDISAAVAWRFLQFVMPDALDHAKFPALIAFCERAEALPEFVATPLD